MQQNLGRELKVHGIEFNPFSFATSLNGVELREADGTLLISFQSLSADLQLRDLFDGKVTLSEIALQAPWVHLQIDRDGGLNLARLIEEASAGEVNSGRVPPPMSQTCSILVSVFGFATEYSG